MKLLMENFKRFLNEDDAIVVGDVHWRNIIRTAPISWAGAEMLGYALGIENFEQEFFLKLYEYWDKQVDPEDADPDDPDPYGEYSQLYWNAWDFGESETGRNVQGIFDKLMKNYGDLNVIQNDRELTDREKYMHRTFYKLMADEMRGLLGPEVKNYPSVWEKTNRMTGETVYYDWKQALKVPNIFTRTR